MHAICTDSSPEGHGGGAQRMVECLPCPLHFVAAACLSRSLPVVRTDVTRSVGDVVGGLTSNSEHSQALLTRRRRYTYG